jgi:hypothetical protein
MKDFQRPAPVMIEGVGTMTDKVMSPIMTPKDPLTRRKSVRIEFESNKSLFK